MAANRVIGRAGGLPWHLPEDFRWFKRVTMGHVLLMGRRTFEGIGRVLPGRRTLVLSRGGFAREGVETVDTLDAVDRVAAGAQVYVCGGADVYRQALPRCAELYLTRVVGAPEGDAWFPEFESAFELRGILLQGEGFEVEHWVRRGAGGL